jgi:putative transposase
MPRFHVHQKFDKLMVYGGNDGTSFIGNKPAVYDRVQDGGTASGRVSSARGSSKATWHSRLEPGTAAMCRLLGGSRSGFIQWRSRPPSKRELANAVLDAKVAAIHTISEQCYGRPRIVRHLRAQGMTVGPERVRRSLQRQQLRPVYKRPYRITTDSDHAKPVAPNMLERRFDGWQPNQAWVADITYIHTHEGWLYLACVLDLGSRRIVGWSMGERMKAQLVCDALKMAYWQRKPAPGLILHSDRRGQYASRKYRSLLTGYKSSSP